MGFNKQTRGQGNDPTFPRLLGERLCLDFVNTVESPRDHAHETLYGYSDLVRWCRHADILDEAETNTLLDAGERQPETAADVFEQAIALRETLTRIFRAIAHGQPAAEVDLQQLQAAYVSALKSMRFTPTANGYDWAWDTDNGVLERPLWDLARSGVAVLTSDDLSRVKECPGASDCGWLFYDTSKNNSRRWCSMEGCGSRVKMRRQYARQR